MAALAIAFVAFVVYAAGACPTIYVGDSGELVTAAHVLGIPHPTGYPLYVLLGKLWTLILPFGSIAWRMSLFSAAAAALACGLLYQATRNAGVHAFASATAALTLAFSLSFWGEANVQRVYALGAVFVIAATMVVFRWRESRDLRTLCLAFFVCGLGASNHTFMAVYAAALMAYAAVSERRLLLARPLVAIAASFIVGLLPYAYLPLRSLQDPPLDWGNPETPRNFLDVVLRSDFWDRAWVKSPADALVVAIDYLHSFVGELSVVGMLLAVAGIAVAWRRRWPVVLLLMIMAANLAVVALHGSRADIFIWHRYYIPSYVIACLFVAAGVDWVSEKVRWQLRWVLLVLLPLVLLVNGWSRNDRSRFEIADAYARMVLQSVPPGAHLAATDDNILFSLMYLTMVEDQRPDVDLILQGVSGAQPGPMHFDFESERLFFTHHPNWTLEGLDIVPRGLVFEARRSGAVLPEPVIESDRLPGEFDDRVPKDYLTQNMIGDFHYMLGFTLQERDWPRAQAQLELAAESAPNNAVLFYNLGLLYRRAGKLDDALAAFERSHRIDPRPLKSRSRASAEDQIAEVKAEIERLDLTP